MRYLDFSGCGVGVEMALEGFDFEDLAFFGSEDSGAEETSVNDFHLVAVWSTVWLCQPAW